MRVFLSSTQNTKFLFIFYNVPSFFSFYHNIFNYNFPFRVISAKYLEVEKNA